MASPVEPSAGRPTGDPAVGALAIRTPLWGRLYVVTFGAFFVFFLVWSARGTVTGIVSPVALAVVAGLIIWRTFAIGIRSDGDDLVITGWGSRDRVGRREITDVARSYTTRFPATPLGSSVVLVQRRDGSSVTAPPLAVVPIGRWSDRRTDRQVANVRVWAGLTP